MALEQGEYISFQICDLNTYKLKQGKFFVVFFFLSKSLLGKANIYVNSYQTVSLFSAGKFHG